MNNELIGKNIGHATAYAYAKAHGYEGTEEDFAQMLANYDTLVEQASGYAESAGESASEASGYADDASASATAADQAAQRISGITASTTVAGMTDTTKVYVYLGSETGYTSGNWYYYSGSAWVSGGVYQSTALVTDTTLTQSGMAADAKATGDEVADLKEELIPCTNIVFKNLLNQSAATVGKYWSDNISYINSDYCYTELIEVTVGKTYYLFDSNLFHPVLPMRFVTFFNSSEQYNGTQYENKVSFTVPEGSAYVRISIKLTDISNLMLTDIENPAEFLPYGEYKAALENEFYELKNGVSYSDTTNKTEDITSKITWTSGYMAQDGGSADASYLHYSQRIPVKEGDVISRLGSYTFRFVTAYTNGSVVSASGEENVSEYTVPSGIDNIIITSSTSIVTPILINRTRVTDINSVEKILISMGYEENVIPVSDVSWASGYMDRSGSTGSASNLHRTPKISVAEGDVLFHSGDYTFRFLTAFSGDIAISSLGKENAPQYTVPKGITDVVISEHVKWTGNIYHFKKEKRSNVESDLRHTLSPLGYTREKSTLSNGGEIVLPYHNVKNGNRYVFNARVSSFSAVEFSKGTNAKATITATQLIIKNDESTYTLDHGLIIGDTVSLLIENENSVMAKFTVSSDGMEYKPENEYRFLLDASAKPKVTSDGSALTNCVFSWTSEYINKPIWLFGDSYFSFYDARWTYYLERDGFINNCMLNGFAGETSVDAYHALLSLLEIRVPKMVVWCLGMNDGDTGGTVEVSWKVRYDNLIKLSQIYGFEVVLYTTPTTPVVNNDYKNAIVRASGYRYVDADGAVDNGSDSTWIPGTLSTDNVHPTALGAKILYYQFLCDVPELMSK